MVHCNTDHSESMCRGDAARCSAARTTGAVDAVHTTCVPRIVGNGTAGLAKV
jgi:hypothetical protein